MKTLTLERRGMLGGATIGHLCHDLRFLAYSMERPWLNNEKNVSCIPAGMYDCVLEYSPKFDAQLYELKDVPGRTEIKIHAANWPHELQGCIALGAALGDESMPINGSKKALNNLHHYIHDDQFLLVVGDAI